MDLKTAHNGDVSGLPPLPAANIHLAPPDYEASRRATIRGPLDREDILLFTSKQMRAYAAAAVAAAHAGEQNEKFANTQIKTVPAVASAIGAEPSDRLMTRFGISGETLRAQIKPLFMLLYDHGITSLTIQRAGAKAMVTVDGQSI